MFFFFSSRRRHTRYWRDWSSDVCSSDLLARPEQVRRGYVVRVPLAYPMYDEDYAEKVATIRSWLDPIKGLVQVGRNGLHRYNNSDHSMLSAMRAVDNMILGAEHDIWAVNVESAYTEEETAADAETR